MTDAVTYHLRREREQRRHAANACSKATRAIHNALADRHADKAWGLWEDAEIAAAAIYERLKAEAAAEEERIGAAFAERKPCRLIGPERWSPTRKW